MRKKIFYFTLIILAVGIIGGIMMIFSIIQTLPNPSQLNERRLIQSTKIYDRSGEILLYEIHGEEKRTIIPPEEIPDYVKQATIAVEDQNFYNHPAFDWRGIARAIKTDILRGRFAQGGSTITQQLARNSFLTPERTLMRKIKEIILALQLERTHTKDEILYLYLNQIPYGSNAYGIEAASRTYFNKPAKDLNLAEAALLASLPQAPTYYSPWGSHVDELKQRQEYVLEQMFKLGFIDEEELNRAKSTELNFAAQSTGKINAPHFVIAVQNYLTKKYGEELVEKGGLKVITTLDWNLQQLAEKVVAEGAARNEELYGGKNAALLVQDAKTGQVLAMVGSRDYFDREHDGNFNVAMQGLRQPGSAFKPFAYLTAFKKGFTPDTVVFDVPTEFDTSGNPEHSYRPNNFDEKFRGPVTLRQALAQSINVPSVKVLYLAGIDETLQTANIFGITTLNERSRYGLSLVLGGGEVKLNELVNAYAIFAQEGKKREQTLVMKVENSSGEILEEYHDEFTQVFEPQPVRLLNDVLSDENARLPLFQNSFNLTVVPGHQIALKTGTTNDYRDAWAIGYTPSLVVGVWVGNNDNLPMHSRGSSILAAVPIWHAFMSKALKDKDPETFTRPDTIIATKPILNGNFTSADGIHSILYYVQKDDPGGPPPLNPASDPQFKNWEEGVLAWGRSFTPDLIRHLTTQTAQEVPRRQGNVDIDFITPQNGEFVSETIPISVRIVSSSPITKIETRLNDRLIDTQIGSFENNIRYDLKFLAFNLQPQNEIIIAATNAEGITGQKSIIVYR